MDRKKITSIVKLGLICSVIIFCGFILVIDAKGVSESIVNSISVCERILVPSLFSFMLLSTYLVKANIHIVLFKPLWFIFRKFIKLSCDEFGIFVLSLVGGYPVGINLLKNRTAYNKNYNATNEKMLIYCFNSGPAFVVGIVGICIYNDIKAGLIIYLSNVLASITAAIFINRKNKNYLKDSYTKVDYSANCLFSSLTHTGKALATVCFTMIFFNVVNRILSYTGFIDFISQFLVPALGKNASTTIFSFLEVTNVKNFSLLCPLPLASALVSFGGLCVLLQIAVISSEEINIRKFLIWRIPVSVLSGFYCYVLNRFINISAEASLIGQIPVVLFQTSIYGDICILLMSIIFLNSLKSLYKKQ